MLKLLLKCLIILVLVGTILISGAVYDLYRYSRQPAEKEATFQTIEIPEGSRLREISIRLTDKGLIQHPLKFEWIARYQDLDRKLKAGEYQLSASMPPMAILKKLTEGDIYLHHVTIPEGFTIRQTARTLEEAGLVSAEKFISLTSEKTFLDQLGISANSLEGYLFPNTYYFPKGVEEETVIQKMVDEFRKVFSPDLKKRSEEIGFSVHQVVTLASIIEKETGTAEERPLIASVFHNRLKKGMRLESDPTVIYGLKDFDGNLTRKHLKTPNAYNTYVIKGLPPGPIASPGEASLRAALFPSETTFLFFVSKNDGTHYFSSNYKDHRKAVKKYQLRKDNRS
jgi:UPF0755 protein